MVSIGAHALTGRVLSLKFPDGCTAHRTGVARLALEYNRLNFIHVRRHITASPKWPLA